MQIVPKIYTRDFSIILCQIWGRRYKRIFGQDLKIRPRNIFVCHNGLVEAYRGATVNHDVNTILLVKLKKDKNFISDFIRAHQKKIPVFKLYFRDANFTQKKFVNFLELTLDFWQAMFISLYVPTDKRFLVADRRAAMVFRKKIANLEYEIFRRVDVFLENLYQDRVAAARSIYLKEVIANRIPSQKILWQRQKEELFIVDDKVLTLKQFRKLQKRFSFKLEKSIISPAVKEIKGQVACAGKVRGQVQLVMKNQDVALFKKGRVLVSSMTVPTFLPAMKKAIAFVTDEGGITCHAAIVAREMHKPCIIGTKIATKVFKDGDRVEVDAEKGIVRKI